jgi:hypothetical protein
VHTYPFAAADEQYQLTRHGAFDAAFDTAHVLDGDLVFPKHATGADILRAFGFKKAPDAPGLFVVTGSVRVDGGLDLDAGIDFSLGLAVLGDLEAKAVRLDMTMLFVFGDARVEHAILFETNDGTLSVAKRTVCPLVVCHEGDLNIAASGHVFDSTDDGPIDDAKPSAEPETAANGFPTSRVTMTLAEASEKLVAAVFDDDEFDSDKAYRRAAKGQSLFRPVKPATGKATPATTHGLTPVPIREAENVTSLVSDGEHMWMAAEMAMLMFDGKKFTRMWRKDPSGSCDEPPCAPAGHVYTLFDRTLVVSGYAIPELDAMAARGFGAMQIPVATSADLGATWQELAPPTKAALVASVASGVALFRGQTLALTTSLSGPWREVRVVPERGPSCTARCIAAVGDDVWIALVAPDGQGAVYSVSGTTVRQVDYGHTTPIRSIVATHDGGVLLLGDANTALLTHDDGQSFVPALSAAAGDIAAATRVGDAIYAVGGLPLAKKGAKGNVGFLMRSTDGGRTFEMIATDLPGRMWALAAHGDRLFIAGTAKTAFSYPLPRA